ncbi:MAG: hypothetical protein KC416_08290, partial [Myxococcales bacterium]|nr:hypothetical protein [Myxococcales bacterium]
MSAPTDTKETDYRIKGTGGWSNAWLYAAIVGGIGLVLSAYGAFTDPARFAFSWLFGFMAVLTVAMGALFFVLIQFLTVASWSVTVRRLAEFFVAGIPVLAVLFVPVFLLRGHLYSEWLDHGHGAEETHAAADDGGVSPTDLLGSTAKAQDHQPAEHGQEPAHGAGDAHGGEHGEDAAHGDEHGGHHAPHHVLHSKILTHKSAFLSGPFWTARAVFYFLVWIVLGLYYFRASTRQDKSRDLQETVRMQRWAPLGLIFYGWTLSFAAFDWMMSLQPGWYSTIFGVCVFAGALVAIHALLCVMSLSL